MPRRHDSLNHRGYAPGSAYGPQNRASPNEGRSPVRKIQPNGGAQPRLTSGGEAAAIELKYTSRVPVQALETMQVGSPRVV